VRRTSVCLADAVAGTHPLAPEFYDAVHRAAGKDYEGEAELVLALARERVPGATTLLDVACGTGRHLEHLRRALVCTGIDLDPDMLERARGRCPDVTLVRGDMVDFDVGTTFDVVVCLFSSVGYVGSAARLDRAASCMARHLRPHGLLVVEPWFRPGQWTDGHLTLATVDEPGLKLARLSRSGRSGATAILDFHYAAAAASGIDHFDEHHELGLFSWDEYRQAFQRTGLAVEIDEDGFAGRGLILGTPV